MSAWAEAYPGVIYQAYGLAFILLGVVAYVLPRREAVLRFASHLGLLAAFGMLHGVVEFIELERLSNPDAWLGWLSRLLLLASYLPLLEFGRRTFQAVPGSIRLPALRVYAAAGGGVAALALWAAEPLTGLEAGARYFVGTPGALLTGLALLAALRAEPERFAIDHPALWLRIAALAFIGYAVVTPFLSGGDPRLSMWLPTREDFLAAIGVPVQLVRVLCAVAATLALVHIVRQTNATSSDDLLRVLNTINGFVYRCNNDRDWTLVYLAGGVEELCGYPVEDFLSRRTVTWGALIHPEDAGRVWDDVQAALRARRDFEISYRIRARDGELRWVHERGRGIFDANGELRFLEGHVTDDTTRMQAFADLRIKDIAIESSINAIAMAGLDGKIFYVNRAFLDLWRLERPEEALGRLPGEFLQPPGQAQVVIEALQRDGSWQGELQARRTDGSTASLQVSAHLVADAAGKPLCMMGSFVDITVRKQAEATILATRSQLEATLDAIPDLLFELGLDGRYLDYHSARSDLLAAPAEDLLGKKVSDILPPEAADVVMSALREAQEEGWSHGKQFELQLPQGNAWFELSVSRKRTDPVQEPRFIVLSREITARKHMEQALQKERDFATSLINTAPVIILLLDTHGIIQHVNPYFEQLTGYRLDEVKGKEWFATFLPERDRGRIRALFQTSIQNVPTCGNINPIITRSGEEREIEWYDQPMRDAQGNITALLAIGQDVTARSAMELALRASEERLKEAQRMAMIGSWELDLIHNVLTWSDEIFHIFEIDKNKFGATYEAFLNAIHPEDREGVNAAYTHSLETRETYASVHRLLMADGRIKFVQERCQTEFDQTGKPLRSLGTVQDITERRQAEEALRESEERLRLALTAGNQGIFDLNVQTGEATVNAEYALMLGYDPAQFHETNAAWIERLHPDERESVTALYRDYIAGKIPGYRVEFRQRTKSGQWKWILSVGKLLEWDNRGQPLRMLGIHTDISERKQAEAALENSLKDLKQSEQRQRELLILTQHEQGRMAALLSGMSIGILFEDRQGRVEYVNPAFGRMWAITDNVELVGRPVRDVMEHSTHRFARPDHASKYVLHVMETHEISERFEVDLYDGRILTQLSYPVSDPEGRIIGRLWIYEDISHERQTAQQLVYLAERDSLTGLSNRHRFQEQLDRMITTSRRSGTRFALLYFDLDEFKYINDTFGHRAGDTVLVRTAGEVASLVRSGEMFARLGGDEFAILTDLFDRDDTATLAERIVHAIAAIPFRFRGSNLRLTASVGIAIFPDHGDNAEDLVAHADTAMYQAKNLGKNTWALYDQSRDASGAMMERMTWTSRIGHALEHGLFELHFQGIYRTRDRSLSHLEALVRMRDPAEPERIIMPGQFIHIAEKSGQILEIDRWVLRRSIETLARHTDLAALAVNISGRSFDEPTLPKYISSLLEEHGVAPERLIIELTETAAVSEMQDAQRFIEALQQTGCIVCLDDFGTGFSTFAYLKYLGVQMLKIDGMFIRDLPNNPDNQAFVRAMIDVARGLNKITVAEFVEDGATLEMLLELGVDMAQGYHLDRPAAQHPALVAPDTTPPRA